MTIKEQIKELESTIKNYDEFQTAVTQQGFDPLFSATKQALAIIKKQEEMRETRTESYSPVKWVKYNDQPRINLDQVTHYFMGEDCKIAFDTEDKSEYECWFFETEEETQECLKWLDGIAGVQEFKSSKSRNVE